MSDQELNHDAIRFKNSSIDEIERELQDIVATKMSWFFQALIVAGRINGSGLAMVNRMSEEAIKITREHWVK
jgi:hypothetical protein